MKKISIYTRSGKTSPSSYYRILQYSKKFQENVQYRFVSPEWLYVKHNTVRKDIDKYLWYFIFYVVIYFRLCFFLLQDIFSKADCIIISRAISPKICIFPLPQFMRIVLKKSNVIWDFDDDIFASKEITNTEKKILIELSDLIIVTSNYLRQLLPEKVQDRVILLPTTDGDLQNFNLDKLNYERQKKFKKTVELLWVATGYSMPHLEKISDVLEESARNVKLKLGKDLILNVVCNKPFTVKTKYLKINNISWNREIAIKSICSAHIGIMPLINSKTSLGKGGFKIVQYMAAGLPAIASNIGFNKEVIVNGETGLLVDDETDINSWVKAIIKMSSNWELLRKFSLNSLIIWKKKFSFTSNLNEWKYIIQSMNYTKKE